MKMNINFYSYFRCSSMIEVWFNLFLVWKIFPHQIIHISVNGEYWNMKVYRYSQCFSLDLFCFLFLGSFIYKRSSKKRSYLDIRRNTSFLKWMIESSDENFQNVIHWHSDLGGWVKVWNQEIIFQTIMTLNLNLLIMTIFLKFFCKCNGAKSITFFFRIYIRVNHK